MPRLPHRLPHLCALAGLLALAAGPLSAAPAPPPLGTPYPGSVIQTEPHAAGSCARRYKFAAPAPLDAVTAYFAAQGRAAGLEKTERDGPREDNFRMIAFTSAHPHRMLFVLIETQAGKTTGSVTYDTSNLAQCR